MAFNDFCELNKCEHYREWDFLFDDNEMPHRCYSCDNVGQSYDVEEIPDNCPYWNKSGDRDHWQAEAESLKNAFDNMQKLYLEIIIAANDNAEKLDTMTARCNELQAEVERITDDKLQAYDDYTELSKEYDTMTARCKAAEELLVESKDTILYIKQYVDGRGLSAEDDGDNMIKAINDFWGVINE